jgi:hypothetical protein
MWKIPVFDILYENFKLFTEEIMLSKNWIALLAGILMIGTGSIVSAHSSTSSGPTAQGQKVNDIPYNLRDEDDKTDIFAIPSDSSEEEQDEEMDELEQTEKAQQAKKAASSK